MHKYHTHLIVEDKEIYSFGKNRNGQLGTGDRITKFFPTKVNFEGFEDGIIIKSLDGGLSTSGVVTSEGHAYMWGSNDSGQLGLGSNSLQENCPQLVEDLEGVIRIACGDKHTLFLTKSYEVYTCGANTEGQLGLDLHMNKVRAPAKIKLDVKISEIMATSFSVLISKEKSMYLVGESPLGLFTLPELLQHDQAIEKIGVGNKFFVFGDSLDGYYSAGENDRGQLGLGHNDDVKGLRPIDTIMGKKVQNISSGKNFVKEK